MSAMAGAPMNGIFIMIAHCLPRHYRKSDLVTLGCWALVTARGGLVRAAHRALEEEGLRHA
jgi:hypothetical protein